MQREGVVGSRAKGLAKKKSLSAALEDNLLLSS